MCMYLFVPFVIFCDLCLCFLCRSVFICGSVSSHRRGALRLRAEYYACGDGEMKSATLKVLRHDPVFAPR
jgi:hypothetical protein